MGHLNIHEGEMLYTILEIVQLTHAVSKEDILYPHVPAFVSFVCAFDVDFGWFWESRWEHELALSLEATS